VALRLGLWERTARTEVLNSQHRHRASSVPMWLMPSKHWSVRPSGDLCLVQKLVEIAHTDEEVSFMSRPLSRLDP
jgi:hypothetical protein